jgi:ubiquinone/menaquinone biosynthesis C-methylase UbiE
MLQAQIYDRFMRRFLDDAGLTTGMKVLDLGSGPGDVAFLAADIVGPAGSVVGIDMNPAVLDVARSRALAEKRTNVSFVEGDCRTAQLPDDFDAAIGRAVLMYTGDVVQTLRTVVEHVRPGGVVAFAEAEFTAVLGYLQANPSEFLFQEWDRGVESFRRSGNHISMSSQLYRAYIAAGLGAPQMYLHAPLGGSDDWVGFEWFVESIRSVLPILEQYGIATPDDVDIDTLGSRVRAEVIQTGVPLMLVPIVTAWATKPMA